MPQVRILSLGPKWQKPPCGAFAIFCGRIRMCNRNRQWRLHMTVHALSYSFISFPRLTQAEKKCMRILSQQAREFWVRYEHSYHSDVKKQRHIKMGNKEKSQQYQWFFFARIPSHCCPFLCCLCKEHLQEADEKVRVLHMTESNSLYMNQTCGGYCFLC